MQRQRLILIRRIYRGKLNEGSAQERKLTYAKRCYPAIQPSQRAKAEAVVQDCYSWSCRLRAGSELLLHTPKHLLAERDRAQTKALDSLDTHFRVLPARNADQGPVSS